MIASFHICFQTPMQFSGLGFTNDSPFQAEVVCALTYVRGPHVKTDSFVFASISFFGIFISQQELFTTMYIGFLALIFGSFLIYLVEKKDNRKIQSFADALWWGIVSITVKTLLSKKWDILQTTSSHCFSVLARGTIK